MMLVGTVVATQATASQKRRICIDLGENTALKSDGTSYAARPFDGFAFSNTLHSA